MMMQASRLRTVTIIRFHNGTHIQYLLFRSEDSKVLRGFGYYCTYTWPDQAVEHNPGDPELDC